MADKPTHGLRKPLPTNLAAAFVNQPETTPPPVVQLAPAAEPAQEPVPSQTNAPVVATAPRATPNRAPAPKAAPDPAVAQGGSGRKTWRRADGREVRKQTVYFDPELARRLAVFCAHEGRDISETVDQAVRELLAREGR